MAEVQDQTYTDAQLMALYEDVDVPDWIPAPHLHQWAWNQMPKAGWRELRLIRFEFTDLYQWVGKKGADINQSGYSIFEEGATEIFRITRKDPDDLLDPILGRPKTRAFIMGTNPNGDIVFAQRTGVASEFFEWRGEMPDIELDLLPAETTDETQNIYKRIARMGEVNDGICWITDIQTDRPTEEGLKESYRRGRELKQETMSGERS